MGQLAAATALEPVADGRWRGVVDPAWAIGDKAHGGYTMAMATRAALLAAGRPHPLAVSAHFLRPPAFGPAEVHTEVLRAGRRVATVSARLVQDERLCLAVLATVGELADAEPEHATPAPPLPPVEECYQGGGEVAGGVRSRIDIRLDPATTGWLRGEPAGAPRMSGWMRMVDGTEPDPLGLIVAADALPPVVLESGHAGWAPTVELTLLLRGLPAPGWLAVHAHAAAVNADGWFDETAEVYDSRGRLVAQSRQLALTGTALRA